MNKYGLLLRTFSLSFALLTLPLAYGADDGDGSEEQGTSQAQQKISSREKKAQSLEEEAKKLRSKAEDKEKEAAKLRHIETGKSQGMSTKEAKKDFKAQRKTQKSQ